MNDLKPCPFCGGEAELMWNDVGGFAGCFNDDCPVNPSTPTFYVGDEYKTEAEAEPHIIEAWNTRAEVAFVPGFTTVTDSPPTRYVPERTCKNLPSWSARENDFFCSECNYFNDHREPQDNYNFCPNCGARVEE